MSKKQRFGKGSSDSPLDGDAPPRSPDDDHDAKRSVSFEEEFEVVEEAVESMERGELTLDECLREYERGLNSLKNCYQILAEAQQRIEILEGQVGPVAQSGESPVWKSASELAAGGAKTIETGPVETDEQVKGE